MRARSLLVGVLLSAAAMPFAAQAGLYKWVDEQGVVNYGDTPPANAKQTKQLDESASSLSVVPGLSKEEMAQFRERLADARIERLERELEELRARGTPPPPVPAYDTQVVYGGAYWPLHYRRPFPPHPGHLPVHGAPVQKTPPFRGMRLER